MSDFAEEDNQVSLRIENENPRNVKDELEDSTENDKRDLKSSSGSDKLMLNAKLKQILCCAVCLELRRSAIYQCKFGHLICAGCFNGILSESKMLNEIATCPNCQSTISKETCSRNIAVEKTISELPLICPHCGLQISRESFKEHKSYLCDKRPTHCRNNLIGCSWWGPWCQLQQHKEECQQLSAPGFEILKSVLAIDQETKAEMDVSQQISSLLSVETFLYFDLQFQKCSSGEKVFFESSKFSAFDNHWLVRGYLNEDCSEFPYQLVLKSILNRNESLNLHYIIVRGPFSEMEVRQKVHQFKFENSATESFFLPLTLCYHSEPVARQQLRQFFSAKRINFRIFLFLHK